MKKELSVSAQFFWCRIVLGLMWIGAAIAGVFESMLSAVLSGVCLCGAVVVMLYVFRSDCEENDEMSERNMEKAKAKTLDILHLLLSSLVFLTLILANFDVLANVNWLKYIPNVLYFIVGLQNVMVGVYFRKLEAE